MKTAEQLIDEALRKIGVVGFADVGDTATETAQNVIDRSLRLIDVVGSDTEGADSTDTAKTVIEAALSKINAIDPGVGATSSELDDGRDVLNRMLREWIADGIHLPNFATLTADGTVVAVPVSAMTAIIHNLAGLLAPEYGAPPSETVLTVAVNTKRRLRRDPAEALSQLNDMLEEWDSAGIELGWSEIAALGDTMPVPGSSIEAITYNLAVRQAPHYKKEAPESVIALAADLRSRLRRDPDLHRESFNDMLVQWAFDGISLGFSRVADVCQPVNIPSYAYSAVVNNLAVVLAPEYGREAPQSVVFDARQLKDRLYDEFECELSVSHLPGTRRGFDIDSLG